MKQLPTLAIYLTAILFATACGSAGTKPDDMTAKRHHQHADGADRAARGHLAKFDPNARRFDPLSVYSDMGGGVLEWSVESYNPTAHHGAQAERLAKTAAAHRKAAQHLEKAESRACKAIATTVRSACPLHGPVLSWEKIPNGVRFYMRKGVPLGAVGAHITCHVAFGRANGKATMPDCPLYVPSVAVIVDPKKRAVEVTTSAGSAAETELQRRAATHALLRASAHSGHVHGAHTGH